MRIQHLCAAALIVSLVLSGCTQTKKAEAPLAQGNGAGEVISAVQMDAPPGSPQDAQPTIPMVFQLVCYQITVPVGTVSRNEAFWKRIDEAALDPGRYDLLRRNGMRLGTGPVSDLESIRQMIEDTPLSGKKLGTIGAEIKNMEILMRKGIPFQTISYYGNNNEYVGRTFDRCENIFNLSFRRTPRKLGDIRLNLAPMVRSTRKHLEYTARNDELMIQFVAPVKFYLNIEVDLPMEKFLVLGPSDSIELPTIIGHQFFIRDEPAQEMEQVLILVAQPYRLDEPITPEMAEAPQ